MFPTAVKVVREAEPSDIKGTSKVGTACCIDGLYMCLRNADFNIRRLQITAAAAEMVIKQVVGPLC